MPDPAAIRALPNWWVGDRPQHWLAGVFEGGGLKGVAYAGALSAVVDQSAWFGAVTGASAGAITAALIAAGASPDDIGRLTNELADVFMQHIRFGDAKPGTVRAAKPNRAIDLRTGVARQVATYAIQRSLRSEPATIWSSGSTPSSSIYW